MSNDEVICPFADNRVRGCEVSGVHTTNQTTRWRNYMNIPDGLPCRVWRGRIAPNGYGTRGRKYAHRIALEMRSLTAEGWTRKSRADKYGINPATVSRIVRNIWRQEVAA